MKVMKALITDFKNTTIEKSMKNWVSGQNLVCRHEGLRYEHKVSTATVIIKHVERNQFSVYSRKKVFLFLLFSGFQNSK